MKPQLWVPLAGLTLLLLMVPWLSRPADPAQEVHGAALSQVGKAVPHFELPLLNTDLQRKSPQHWRGRVWVLSVWASWCGPCRDEHPLLVELARQGSVTLIGLNYKDDPRDAQEWLLQAGDPYQTTLVDRNGSTGALLGVQGVPETLVIDPAGIIQHRHAGPLTTQVWKHEVLPVVRRISARPLRPDFAGSQVHTAKLACVSPVCAPDSTVGW